MINDLPPSYEYVVSEGSSTPMLTTNPHAPLVRSQSNPKEARSATAYDAPKPLPNQTQVQTSQHPALQTPPPHHPLPPPHHPSHPTPLPITLYHYQNPHTGEAVSTRFPPSHPAMRCLQEGVHVPGKTQWGILGVLSAVLFFPVGVALCIVDRKVVCKRCGQVVHQGISA